MDCCDPLRRVIRHFGNDIGILAVGACADVKRMIGILDEPQRCGAAEICGERFAKLQIRAVFGLRVPNGSKAAMAVIEPMPVNGHYRPLRTLPQPAKNHRNQPLEPTSR